MMPNTLLGDGIININKPVGKTSFQIISQMRRWTGIKKIGHCGTLDPFATGVLLLCLKKATAVIRFMEPYDKRYAVRIRFGQATDTMDTEGEVIANYEFQRQELEALKADDFSKIRLLLSKFQGEIEQMPPMYSALKVAGKPLYKYAREGIEIERKSRKIKIYDLKIKEIFCDLDELALAVELEVHCSKGTYIRSLASDIGEQLGWFAHAEMLTRLACGPFLLQDALEVETLEALFQEGEADQTIFKEQLQQKNILQPLERALEKFPEIQITKSDVKKLVFGQLLEIKLASVDLFQEGAFYSILWDNVLVAVAKLQLRDQQRSDVYQIKTERVFLNHEDI